MSRLPIITTPYCEQDKGKSINPTGKIKVDHFQICESEYNVDLHFELTESNGITQSQLSFTSFKNNMPQLLKSPFLEDNTSIAFEIKKNSSVAMFSLGLPIIAPKPQVLKETPHQGYCGKHFDSVNASQLIRYVIPYNKEIRRCIRHRTETYHSSTNLFPNETMIERFSDVLITAILHAFYRCRDNSDSHTFEGIQ